MAWIIFGIGVVIAIFGLITTLIAQNFNEFSTTPFSKYTFDKLCYELSGFCETCLTIGLSMAIVSLIFIYLIK